MVKQRWFAPVAVVSIGCGLSLMAATAHGDPQSPNFFPRKEVACRVHLRQEAATTNPSGAANKSWQDICDVANYYPTWFDPGDQYPDQDVHECIPGKLWPQCDDSLGPVPDLGFRYPRVANGPAVGTHQNPTVDWWSVCAKADLSDIQSVPGVQDCGTGTLRQEIGQCRASAGYNENLRSGTAGYAAESFYDFVLTHPDCEPCGHDVLTAVTTCKSTCERYFSNLGYDQFGPGHGVWRDGNDPAWPAAKPFAAVAMDTTPIGGSGLYQDRTPLQACLDFCGPPSVHSAPPWVSSNNLTQHTQAERADQWHWVLYERGSVINRNPNETLAGWLRSYAVNTDHSSPTPECFGPIVNQYCRTIITSGVPGSTRDQKRLQCSKALLPGSVDLDANGQPDGVRVLGDWNLATDGFCHAFSHANMFCRDVCYEGDNGNGEATDNVCGHTTASGVKLQFGVNWDDCDVKTALCQCTNDQNDRVSCLSLCEDDQADSTPEDGLQCDDGNVFDRDCCSAMCQREAQGAACEADGNGCTTGTCNDNAMCLETCQVGALCAPAGCGLVCEQNGTSCTCM